jgi:hypothetical protein
VEEEGFSKFASGFPVARVKGLSRTNTGRERYAAFG